MYIDITDPKFIKISTDAAYNSAQLLRKDKIREVQGIFVATPQGTANNSIDGTPSDHDVEDWEFSYGFETMTVINLIFEEDYISSAERIELQTVKNQPTWSLGTQAALDQATSDIKASL